MAARKSRKSEAVRRREAEYERHARRIRRFQREAERRGYVFDGDLLPAKPKRITDASVRRLAKLVPEVLYRKAKFVVPETGEVLSGEQGRKYERSAAAKKGAATKRRKRAAAEIASLQDAAEVARQARETALEAIEVAEAAVARVKGKQPQIEGMAGFGVPSELVNELSYEYLPSEAELTVDRYMADLDKAVQDYEREPARYDYPGELLDMLTDWGSMFTTEKVAWVIKRGYEEDLFTFDYFHYDASADRAEGVGRVADLFLEAGFIDDERYRQMKQYAAEEDQITLYDY